MKEFFIKHKVAFSACILMAALSFGTYYVLGQQSATSIGDNIHTVGDLTVDGNARLGLGVEQGLPSSDDITVNTHTLLSGTGGNYLAFGQYPPAQNYAQWIQSAFAIPSTAIYDIILQPLGGNVGIGTTSPQAKLDVDGIIKGNPVTGRWYATNHGDGDGNYIWGTEVFNTNPLYISRTPDNAGIITDVAGYYVIFVNVLQSDPGTRGDVAIKRNGVDIARSLRTSAGGYAKHNLAIIEYFTAGDIIEIEQASGKVYGNSDPWSSLEIYKLN